MRFEILHIIDLHREIIVESGGAPGILNMDSLESAFYSVFASFEGVELHPSVEEKAAALCFNIINSHAFQDGNKRVGVMALVQFMMANNIDVNCSDKDLIELGLGVANHDLNYEKILEWIKVHEVSLSQSKEQEVKQ